jgi:probable phosphoglycerate mutase
MKEVITMQPSNMSSNSDRNTRVILLRHGQSTYNALGLYQGSSDPPTLTDLGCHQAYLAGQFLKGVEIDAIYSSPLRRAQDTAIAVHQALDYPHTIGISSLLRETELPAWQGMPFQQVKEKFPEEYRSWKQNPHEFQMEIPMKNLSIRGAVDSSRIATANSQAQVLNRQYCYPAQDLYARVQQFWQQILPCHMGQTILVVSHGGTNRALVSTALGVKSDRYHTIEQSNCAVSILNFPNGRLESGTLEVMNYATHVDENPIKLKPTSGGWRLLLMSAETNHPEQIQRIEQLLKDIEIDLSMSGDPDNSRSIVAQILKEHPIVPQLEVRRADFAQLWQQSMSARANMDSDQLHTCLVVASDRTLQSFIGQVLNLDPKQCQRLKIKPGTVSSIYYPDTELPPILQTMNLQ